MCGHHAMGNAYHRSTFLHSQYPLARCHSKQPEIEEGMLWCMDAGGSANTINNEVTTPQTEPCYSLAEKINGKRQDKDSHAIN